MQTSLSDIHLFPTAQLSNSKGWQWHCICVDMFEAPPASLTMELHCRHKHQFSRLSFAYVDESVSADLVTFGIWVLGVLDFTCV